MSKINYGMVFTTSSKAGSKGMKFKEKLSYNSRHEATKNHENLFEDIENISNANGYLTREESIEKHKELFNNYHKEDRILYFTNNKIVRENDIKQIKKNEKILDDVQKKYPNSCLYQSFTSFDYQFAEKNVYNKYSEEEFHELIQPHVKKLFSDNQLDWNNTKYFLTFHSNKDHFHFHLDFIEQVPTRTKNMLDEKSFAEYRKNLILALDDDLKEEYSMNINNIKMKKENLRLLIDDVNIENNLDLEHAIEMYKENPVRYYGDIKDDKLLNAINNIKIDLLKNNEELYNEFKEFEEQLDQQNYFNENLFGNTENRNQKENQFEEVNNRLNNKILNIIKAESKNNKEYERVVTKNNDLPVTKKLKSNHQFKNYKLEKLANELSYVAKKKQRQKEHELNEFLYTVDQDVSKLY